MNYTYPNPLLQLYLQKLQLAASFQKLYTPFQATKVPIKVIQQQSFTSEQEVSAEKSNQLLGFQGFNMKELNHARQKSWQDSFTSKNSLGCLVGHQRSASNISPQVLSDKDQVKDESDLKYDKPKLLQPDTQAFQSPLSTKSSLSSAQSSRTDTSSVLEQYLDEIRQSNQTQAQIRDILVELRPRYPFIESHIQQNIISAQKKVETGNEDRNQLEELNQMRASSKSTILTQDDIFEKCLLGKGREVVTALPPVSQSCKDNNQKDTNSIHSLHESDLDDNISIKDEESFSDQLNLNEEIDLPSQEDEIFDLIMKRVPKQRQSKVPKIKKVIRKPSQTGMIFKCTECDANFEAAQSLGGHMSRVHPGMSKFYQKKIETRQAREGEREILRLAKIRFYDEYGKNAPLDRAKIRKYKREIKMGLKTE